MTINTHPEPRSLRMPAFCIGMPVAGRRRIPALAKEWSERYRATREFPAPEVVPVEPGTLVFTDATADLSSRAGVRIYLVPELLYSILEYFDSTDSDVVRAFEAAYRGTAWGALVLVALRREPETIAELRGSVEALLTHWDSLEQLRYVDFDFEPLALSALVQDRLGGLLAMWLTETTSDVRLNLQTSLAALCGANAEERQRRAVAWLAELAATSKRVRFKEQLCNPTFLRGKLEELSPAERSAIELGSISGAQTFLYGTDRSLGRR